MRSRLVGVIALVAVLAAVGGQAAPGAPSGGPLATPTPAVEGPVGTTGIHGHPWYDPPFEVASIGYVEEEYFVSGTARTMTTEAPSTAPYTTRILVVRPKRQGAFNGTVVVEWDNVTAQAAFSPMFTWLHPMLLRAGYAFVSVSAQSAGVCCSPLSHKVWDPVRYESLSHPGDDYSFDIYSQVVQALRAPGPVDPMGGLDVRDVIATGNSQSASRLHTYVNEVQDRIGLIDAFFLDAGGSKTFDHAPSVPVLHFLSEDGISAEPPNVLGTANYRLWEVPGASHNDADTARHIDGGGLTRNSIDTPKHSYAEHEAMHAEMHYGEEGPSTFASCQPVGQGGNEFPRRYAVMAAMRHLERWVTKGKPAPQPPRVRFEDGEIVRDAYGHPVGGVRLPPLDVPVARYLATTCGLFGQTVPLDPGTLATLYPTHDAYVAAMRAATERALAKGYLLAPEAAELMGLAERSAIPAW